VPGNWDHRAFPTKQSIATWHKRLQEETGVRVLVNQNAVLHHQGSRIWLVGTDDPYFGYADLDASFKGVPETAFALVLTHAPEEFEELARRRPAKSGARRTHSWWAGPAASHWRCEGPVAIWDALCAWAVQARGHDLLRECWDGHEPYSGTVHVPARVDDHDASQGRLTSVADVILQW